MAEGFCMAALADEGRSRGIGFSVHRPHRRVRTSVVRTQSYTAVHRFPAVYTPVHRVHSCLSSCGMCSLQRFINPVLEGVFKKRSTGFLFRVELRREHSFLIIRRDGWVVIAWLTREVGGAGRRSLGMMGAMARRTMFGLATVQSSWDTMGGRAIIYLTTPSDSGTLEP
jgi:hypothetical protein